MSSPESPSTAIRKAREIEEKWDESGVLPKRLAVLTSFTGDFVRPYLVIEADQRGLAISPWFAPFGQSEQIVLDRGSPLWANHPDVVWMAMRIEDVDRNLAQEMPQLGASTVAKRLARVRERLVNLAHSTRERTNAALLVSNFACPSVLDVFDANDPDGLVHLVAAENRQLARDLQTMPGAHVFDWAGLIAMHGSRSWEDRKLWYTARAPLASSAQPVLARRLVRCIGATLSPAAKCVVVDLDNTLWGGVLGDDGPEGIQLGDDHPGAIYKDFQRALLELRARGFLLAIASKNDAKTVESVLDSHPEVLLRRADFAVCAANWEPKAVNLRRIAESLNMGLDALVFVDDNPVERAEVRAALPQVAVVELPADPLGYIEALRNVAALDRPRLLSEDRARAVMYTREERRREAEAAAPDLETFLAGLEMRATVGCCNEMTLERIHQLIQKTNQFNLTTRRHSIEEVARLARTPKAAVAWLRLEDRYGDMGLVCVGIVRRLEEVLWEIDTLLMSCRVMGRRVEDAFLAYLFELAAAGGAQKVRGIYERTPKNAPVERFYEERGFVRVHSTDTKTIYELDGNVPPRPWPAVIARARSEGAAS
jgi:FkbH-like protein